MATPPSCALSNVYILSSHRKTSLETNFVPCDVSTYLRAWVNWILEGDVIKEVPMLGHLLISTSVEVEISHSVQTCDPTHQ